MKITNKKLPRVRARLRSLYRRVVLPIKVIAIFASVSFLGNLAFCQVVEDSKAAHEAKLTAHFNDWEKTLEERQAKIDTREYDLARREQSFETRVQTLEDIAGVMMQNRDAAAFKEAMKRTGVSK